MEKEITFPNIRTPPSAQKQGQAFGMLPLISLCPLIRAPGKKAFAQEKKLSIQENLYYGEKVHNAKMGFLERAVRDHSMQIDVPEVKAASDTFKSEH